MVKHGGSRNKSKRYVPPRKKPGIPNKLESSYANDVLNPLLKGGEIFDYKYEALRFRLADNTTYTPDYFVVFPDRLELHEVKGRWMQAARVKIKVAAEIYPWFKWIAIQRKKSVWVREEFN